MLFRSVDVDRFVVELAAIGNAVLEAGDAGLQLREGLIGFQIGVLFGNRKKVANACAQPGFCAAERLHVL